jgi:hypothetical protein
MSKKRRGLELDADRRFDLVHVLTTIDISHNTSPTITLTEASADRAFGCMHASPILGFPGFFWITSLLYNTDARMEGRKRERRVCMDRNGSEPARYTGSSVREREVYRKKPQYPT